MYDDRSPSRSSRSRSNSSNFSLNRNFLGSVSYSNDISQSWSGDSTPNFLLAENLLEQSNDVVNNNEPIANRYAHLEGAAPNSFSNLGEAVISESEESTRITPTSTPHPASQWDDLVNLPSPVNLSRRSRSQSSSSSND